MIAGVDLLPSNEQTLEYTPENNVPTWAHTTHTHMHNSA